MSLRRRTYLTEGWMGVKRFFPGVRNPLFHGTSGPKSASIILYKEGIKQKLSHRSGSTQNGISLTRSLDKAFTFGPYVVVVDKSKLKGKTKPYQYWGKGGGWDDEMEERYFGDIPFKAIVGLVMDRKAQAHERNGGSELPMIHKVKGKYERVE